MHSRDIVKTKGPLATIYRHEASGIQARIEKPIGGVSRILVTGPGGRKIDWGAAGWPAHGRAVWLMTAMEKAVALEKGRQTAGAGA